jgi:hypothetical protein
MKCSSYRKGPVWLVNRPGKPWYDFEALKKAFILSALLACLQHKRFLQEKTTVGYSNV